MKKIRNITIATVMLLTVGCASQLNIALEKEITSEYGEKLNTDSLYDINKTDAGIKVKEVKDFDEKKLGDQNIKVIFTNEEGKTKEESITIAVKDTKAPNIELNKEKLEITAGSNLNLKENIKSVKDPIDGDIKYSDKEVEKDGYYIDKGKLDTKKEGTYEVNVIAVDKNGNKTEKKFTVKVNKKEEKKEPSNTSTSNTNKGNSASKPSNNNSSSNASTPTNKPSTNTSNSSTNNTTNKPSGNTNTSKPAPSKPKPVCPNAWYDETKPCNFVPDYKTGGKPYFHDEAEAEAYGQKYIEDNGYDGSGYFLYGKYDNGGNRIWVIDVY